MSRSKAEGECGGGIPWPTFPDSTTLPFRFVTNLKHVPQAEAPGQVNRPFSQRLGVCFSLLSVQCPEDGSLPRTVSDCHSPVGPRNRRPPGHQSQAIKECPLYALHVPASSSMAEGEHRLGAHLLVLVRQWERAGLWHICCF